MKVIFLSENYSDILKKTKRDFMAMFNENSLKDNFYKFKGRFQRAWGALVSSEMERTQGDLKQVSGRVQKSYGREAEKFKEQLHQLGETIVEKKDTIISNLISEPKKIKRKANAANKKLNKKETSL